MNRVLPLRCFLFVLPNYTNILVGLFLFALFSDKPEVFLFKYSQTAILHAAHFRRVEKICEVQVIYVIPYNDNIGGDVKIPTYKPHTNHKTL